MIEFRERDFSSFFEVPFKAYQKSDYYVSAMRSDLKQFLTAGLNPLFKSTNDFTYFSALDDGQPVGRIVVHIHRASNAAHNTNRASFGFFDCIDNQDIANSLLSAAQKWATKCGLTELVGNFNLTAMQQMGVQTGNFAQPGFTDMVVNPPHIPGLLKKAGFQPFFPMTTFELDLTSTPVPNRKLADDEGYEFASISPKTFSHRMEEARLVLNDGFAQNPMFVPLTSEEFVFQAGEMTKILDPRLSSILLHNKSPVGVVICIPDLNGFLKATRSRIGIITPYHFLRYRLNRKRAVIIFYSVARAMHGRGIMGAMLARTIKALKDARYERLGITWIADENIASLRQMERLGAKPLQKLHLFRKSLV